MDSDDIFIGLKRRDEAALSVLFDTYYEKLYLFAEKYIYDSDKAHDIVQDVFLKIWENAERLELHPALSFRVRSQWLLELLEKSANRGS